MTRQHPICVCLYSAPGSGKSTMAANIFSKLKVLDINCELVTEFAKDLVWDSNMTAISDQTYVLACQWHRLYRLIGKVDVIVTDSPIALSPFYNKDKDIDAELKALALKLSSKFSNLNYFINRANKYSPIGRLETEEESNQKVVGLKRMLDEYGIKHKDIDSTLANADIVVQNVIETLKKGNDK